MPKGKKSAITIPQGAQFAIVDGDTFIRLKSAARLAGIHPVVLEMAAALLKRVGGAGAAFALATPELERAADDILSTFKTGLRRFAKVTDPNKKIRVKAVRDGKRLVFWYTA